MAAEHMASRRTCNRNLGNADASLAVAPSIAEGNARQPNGQFLKPACMPAGRPKHSDIFTARDLPGHHFGLPVATAERGRCVIDLSESAVPQPGCL